jgi:microcystin-dependent protein
MDKINFIAKDNFPDSSDTMELLQQMTNLSAGMARLGGTDYILSGCADDGNGNVGAGLIVINGEILPFEAGAKKAKITIRQTSETLTAFGVEYPESYIYRTARFSDTGEYAWADFVQVLTNRQIENKINALKEESTGFIKMWSGRIDRIPEDYMLCNGDTVTVAQYPELAYSLGKETEQSFTLPDLRRRFIAGYDNAVNSGYSQMWGTGGSETVTLTPEQMPVHSHTIEFTEEKWGDNANSRPFPSPAGTSGYTAQTASAGGGQSHENRPPYYVLAYVIKVK